MKRIRHDAHTYRRNERGAFRLWSGLLVAALIAFAALSLWPEGDTGTGSGASQSSRNAETHEHGGQLYTCGMHPQVLSETPGTCPICQMDLTPVKVQSDAAVHQPHEQAEAELFTCGMHPQVLSETPGTCPICQMDLTPVKVERGSATKPASDGERKVKFWRAPMDPNFISDKPGKSPMGMDLVPVYEDAATDDSDMAVTISPILVQNMGVRTAPVEKKPTVKTVRTVGSIDYDEQRVRDVTTKFDGWIEELNADYTGQQVEMGMPLFTVYSPEIYSSQEEYLLALRNKDIVKSDALPQAAQDMRDLAESSRLRLQLFDISDDQIDELARRGKPEKTMTIRSPHTGIIVEKMAREGMQVRPGMKLYTIADLSRVWVYVDVYENEVAFVKLGQDAKMTLSYLPGKSFHGKVIYVYPFVDTDTRTVKVRLEFDNPHLELKPGMFADVQIEANLGRESLQVPRSAVIDTGERKIAFVALSEGRFEPRPVRTGVNLGDDYIEVLDGLRDKELVVTSGQFLLDSESKLREAVLKMIGQRRGGAAEAATVAPSAGDEIDAGHAGHDHVVRAETPDIGSAAELSELAQPIIERYLELQLVLSQDDHAGLENAVRALHDPLDQFLTTAPAQEQGPHNARERVAEAREVVGRMKERSLDAVRAQFSDLSKQVTALLALVGPTNVDLQLYAFYCPMAGSGWFQKEEQPRNPYYGFSMHRCGDSVSLLKDH